MLIHMHHRRIVHKTSVILRERIGPSKSGGACNGSPMSSSFAPSFPIVRRCDQSGACRFSLPSCYRTDFSQQNATTNGCVDAMQTRLDVDGTRLRSMTVWRTNPGEDSPGPACLLLMMLTECRDDPCTLFVPPRLDPLPVFSSLLASSPPRAAAAAQRQEKRSWSCCLSLRAAGARARARVDEWPSSSMGRSCAGVHRQLALTILAIELSRALHRGREGPARSAHRLSLSEPF